MLLAHLVGVVLRILGQLVAPQIQVVVPEAKLSEADKLKAMLRFTACEADRGRAKESSVRQGDAAAYRLLHSRHLEFSSRRICILPNGHSGQHTLSTCVHQTISALYTQGGNNCKHRGLITCASSSSAARAFSSSAMKPVRSWAVEVLNLHHRSNSQ